MKTLFRGLLLCAALVAAAGCSKREDVAAVPTAPAKVAAAPFVVLATSDLRDVQPLEQMAVQATGVNVRFRFGGTMESTEAVLTGHANAHAAWFANAKYLLSDQQGQSRVKLQEKIMLSPIVVGVSESAAKSLGWDRPDVAAKVSWRTIAAAAATGKLFYGMSNPATSNQGFMSLMGVVSAASDKAEALTAEDVDRGAIAQFLKGYKLVGDNSAYLTEKFIEGQGPRLNAYVNYESLLLSLNASGKLREKLVLVYPHEGVATADYPLMLLDDARRDDYKKVAAWMQGKEAQTWLARQTLRRPVNAEVAASVVDVLPSPGLQIELPFSPDRKLADGLVESYLNEFRTPIASTFVLDVSGSMGRDGRLGQLVKAVSYISGADGSMTGRIAKLTSRERVWMMSFSNEPNAAVMFEVPAGKARSKGVEAVADSDAKLKTMDGVREYAEGLRADGNTALYDSIFVALQNMAEERKKNPGYQYSVVGFTDGENNRGRDFEAFKRDYAQLPEAVRAIPVFMVLFGEGKEKELKSLISVTGGKIFDARTTPLYSVFKDIRAYQ